MDGTEDCVWLGDRAAVRWVDDFSKVEVSRIFLEDKVVYLFGFNLIVMVEFRDVIGAFVFVVMGDDEVDVVVNVLFDVSELLYIVVDGVC